MNKLFLSCNNKNIASYKTIEKLGGNLKEVTIPPKDYFGYHDGMGLMRIYELTI